jgi:protein-disulfide isomerase
MRLSRRLPLLAGFLLTLAGPACGRKTPDPSLSSPTARPASNIAGSPVVASVNGEPITQAEVDLRAADRLVQIRQEEYDARAEAIGDIVAEKLLAREAANQSITVEHLIKDQVDAKAAPVSPADAAVLYAANASRFAGKSREKAIAEIETALRQRNAAERMAAFRKELKGKAQVAILLEPPRLDLAIPASSPALGPPKAKVTLIEFADYQCPYCKRAEDTVAAIIKEYQGRIRFVHGDFPLSAHDRAGLAARASRCAGEQGKFWEYRHSLLVVPGDFSDADFARRAAASGIEAKAFGACVESERNDAAIQASQDEGMRAGVNATPTFFFNGRKLAGAPPIEEFRRILDEELARKGD